jgi:hypothetical protein
LVEGDSIMELVHIALVNKETKIVDHVVVISKENYEKDFADLKEYHSDYDCIDAESWTHPENILGKVNVGYSYDGTTFVPYDLPPNTVTEEDIKKAEEMIARDIALGVRPDLASKPEGAPGPKEDEL